MLDTPFIPVPDPNLHDWVKFKRLPRLSWEFVVVVGVVLAYSADQSAVLVGYFSPSNWRPTTAWVALTKIIEVLKPAADEALFAASST